MTVHWFTNRSGLTFVLAGSILLLPVMVRAQDTSSVDDIINSLKPKPGMTTGTRGIRPVGPALPAPAPAARATPVGMSAALPRHPTGRAPVDITPQPTADVAPAKSLRVEFATGSAALTPAAVGTLARLGTALADPKLAGYKFRIEGHTDTVGTPDGNKALSERRAQAVVAFVVSHYHVDPARLQAEGVGQDGLLVATPPQTGEPRNRRVEIVNLGS